MHSFVERFLLIPIVSSNTGRHTFVIAAPTIWIGLRVALHLSTFISTICTTINLKLFHLPPFPTLNLPR